MIVLNGQSIDIDTPEQVRQAALERWWHDAKFHAVAELAANVVIGGGPVSDRERSLIRLGAATALVVAEKIALAAVTPT